MTSAPKGRKRSKVLRKSIPPAKPPAPNTTHTNLPALSPRHARFVEHYMIDFNGSKAAIACGYSKRSAGSTAYDILNYPQVRAEIIRRRHAMAEDMAAISKERIEYELASVGLSNMADFAPMFGDGDVAEKLANLTRTQAAAVKEIVVEEFRDGRSDWRTVRRTKFKVHDKAASLRLMAEIKGLIVEKVDHKHDHTGTIMHAMLQEIAAASDGKPIVDVVPNQIEGKAGG